MCVSLENRCYVQQSFAGGIGAGTVSQYTFHYKLEPSTRPRNVVKCNSTRTRILPIYCSRSKSGTTTERFQYKHGLSKYPADGTQFASISKWMYNDDQYITSSGAELYKYISNTDEPSQACYWLHIHYLSSKSGSISLWK